MVDGFEKSSGRSLAVIPFQITTDGDDDDDDGDYDCFSSSFLIFLLTPHVLELLHQG